MERTRRAHGCYHRSPQDRCAKLSYSLSDREHSVGSRRPPLGGSVGALECGSDSLARPDCPIVVIGKVESVLIAASGLRILRAVRQRELIDRGKPIPGSVISCGPADRWVLKIASAGPSDATCSSAMYASTPTSRRSQTFDRRQAMQHTVFARTQNGGLPLLLAGKRQLEDSCLVRRVSAVT